MDEIWVVLGRPFGQLTVRLPGYLRIHLHIALRWRAWPTCPDLLHLYVSVAYLISTAAHHL